MRLIDADDLIGVIQYNTNYKPNKSAIMADELIRYINSQPIAYDVDKVVEQLEKERDLGLKSTGKYYHKPLVRAHYQNAISIVKGGGQE